MSLSISPSRSKADLLHIVSLDVKHCKVEVVAQYNPAQIQIDEGAGWSPSANNKSDLPHLEYTKSQPRTLTVELFFDGYETRQNVQRDYVAKLSLLRRVMKPSGDEEAKRPPIVELRWAAGLESFRGVVESLSTKLTMFLPDGTPVRATCSLKLTEAVFDWQPPGRG